MPSRQSVEDLRQANASIAALITEDIEGFWATLDLSRPEASRDALLEVVPGLVTKYGDVAATVAADWYDAERAESSKRGSYRAVAAAAYPDEAAIETVRRTAQYLFTDTPLAMLSALTLEAGRYSVQPSRSTIALNSGRDRVRWGRIPTGATTCAFCLTMASRGFVYLTKERAGYMDKYHGKCDCVPAPDFDELGVEDYEPADLYSKYLDARNTSGSGDLSDILSTLREQEGIR